MTVPGGTVPGSAPVGTDVVGTAPGTVAGTVEGSAPGTVEGSVEGSVEPSGSEVATTDETAAGADFKEIDPLKAVCDKILTPARMKTAVGVTVADGSNRIVDVANPERAITGRVKCQYGIKDDTVQVTVSLTQYENADAAKAQIATSIETEDSLGAQLSEVVVNGYPAEVMIRDGGLLLMQYDTWTLGVVAQDKLVDNAALPKSLTALAETVINSLVG